MPVDSLHLDYVAHAGDWSRARDVMSGEDAVKAAGERYLPRLDAQTDADYLAYVQRAAFFNATGRTCEAYVGLLFRRAPMIRVPGGGDALGAAMAAFLTDCDLLGATFDAYARQLCLEVLAIGRAGTLVDWSGGAEDRAYVSLYTAEQIINWRTERLDGRNVLTLVVLSERVELGGPDLFERPVVEQRRVLRLEETGAGRVCVVELWRRRPRVDGSVNEWEVVERRTPLRLGRPLTDIPFVFHGPVHARADVSRSPVVDITYSNLDHYRLSADYHHGLHFTALPTAYVAGFEKGAELPIGGRTAWVSETAGATAGYLEFRGDGLQTFERAMDRAERHMAVLGSRILETLARSGDTATAIELRQSGEHSILGSVGAAVSDTLTHVLQWVYWWNSAEPTWADIPADRVLMVLNADFSIRTLNAQELAALVAAWQAGAISRESLFDLLRKGELLPDGRSNEAEIALLAAERGAGAGVVSA